MKSSGFKWAAALLAAATLVGAGVWFGRQTAVDTRPEPQTQAAEAILPKTAAEQPAGTGEPTATGPAASAIDPAAAVQATVAPVAPVPAGETASDPLPGQTVLMDYFKGLTDANSAVYVVKPGDNLTRIAKQYGVTPGLIAAANGVQVDRIYPGRSLRIPTAKFSVLVDKTRNALFLKADGTVVRGYRIATGKDRSTPEGSFKIKNHLKNPTWYYEGKVIPHESPDNPLGTRWMGFDKEGYGLHGTTKPEEIGQFATLGCVRMLNEDIEFLYELLAVGTEVNIIP